LATSENPILIVGGGFGGLTAALALGRHGIPVQVFEGAPAFGAIGYGIQFGPNIFHVFDRLGISEEVMSVGDEPESLLMLDALNGDQIVHIPTGDSFRTRFSQPYLIVHRIDLHTVLLEACKKLDAVQLEPDAMMTGFTTEGDKVSVITEDGRSFTGRALIGADGVNSNTRAQLIDDGSPIPNGYVAHRTIVPMKDMHVDVPRDVVILWGGPGFHVVHYPLRHDTEFNIVAVLQSENKAERGDAIAYRAELEAATENAAPELKELIAMMDLEQRFMIGDRDPIRHWHQGRVGLLGDAAHPTLQSLAQGACMAIEDGLHLANLIHAKDDDFDAAFTQFTTDRHLRTARVTLESRYIWDFYHGDGIEREVQYQRYKERNEADAFECVSWLYDGFPFDAG